MTEPPIPPRDRLAHDAGSDLPVIGFHVIYDADCGLCSWAVRWLQARQSDQLRSWVPIASEQAHILAPDRPPDEMAVAGPGGAWFGGDAAIVCLWMTPAFRWISRALALPPVRPLVRWVYCWVARNRYRISRLWGESCQIP